MNVQPMHGLAATYSLFADIFSKGLTQNHLILFEEMLPEWPAIKEHSGGLEEGLHHRVFGLDVFLQSSPYLSETGLVGSAIPEEVIQLARMAGTDPELLGEGLDHLSVQLRLLGRALSQFEVPHYEERINTYLQQSLLTWLPAWVIATRRSDDTWYGYLALLLLELIVEHSASLPAPVASEAQSSWPASPLKDPKFGIKKLADFLIRPHSSGLLITRTDLSRLGRGSSIPTGFGTRSDQMKTLLESAVRFDRLNELLLDISQLAAEWHIRFEELEDAFSTLAGPVLSWKVRLNHTQSLLETIKTTVAREKEQATEKAML